MLCVFLDMSHAAQPSSSPSPPPLLHLLSDLWPHTDIMLTSGPHLSLCPQTSCVFSSPHPTQATSPLKKKRNVIALFCDQPPSSPVLCLAPPTGGRCFWLTCLLFFLSLFLSLALSPSTQTTLSRLSAMRPVYMLLWHFLGCTSFHDLCMQGPKVTFCLICQWRVKHFLFSLVFWPHDN